MTSRESTPPGENSILDPKNPIDHLRWAKCALELVANGLRNRRSIRSDDVEMINLKVVKASLDDALSLLRSEIREPVDRNAMLEDDLFVRRLEDFASPDMDDSWYDAKRMRQLLGRAAAALRAPKNAAEAARPSPAAQERTHPNGLWMVYFEDASIKPELFFGEGAEQAARTHYQSAKDAWSCHLLSRVPDPQRPAHAEEADAGTPPSPRAAQIAGPCQRLGCRLKVAQGLLDLAKERGELSEAERASAVQSHSAPKTEQEPVAWRWKDKFEDLHGNGSWRYQQHAPTDQDAVKIEPMYGHPWLRSTPAPSQDPRRTTEDATFSEGHKLPWVAPSARATKCAWTPDDDGVYHTGCDNAFTFIDAGPKENQMEFCCYCGGTLDVKGKE